MNFSIITTVRNNLPMIGKAINNVSTQTNVDVEHIVVDGNSTDGTKEFLFSVNNPKMKVISEKDKSIYDALNKGLLLAKNDIVGILHSDDEYADERVLQDVQKLFESGADVVYADLEYVNRDDISKVIRVWKAESFHPLELQFGWMPPHPTFFFRRTLLSEIGLYNLDLRISADYDHMLRFLMKKDLRVGYLPRVVSKMRVGGESNKSLKNVIKKMKEDYKVAKLHFQSPLGTIVFKNLRKITQIQFKNLF